MECLTEVLEAPDIGQEGRAIVKQAVARATSAHKQGVLLRVTFETLFEYLKVSAQLSPPRT